MLRSLGSNVIGKQDSWHERAANGVAEQAVNSGKSVEGYFASRFGLDPGGVRIHTGAGAASMARGVGAKAFTKGRDIVFGEGRYAPGNREGQRLLAHELTHVVQTVSGDVSATAVQRDPLTKEDIQDQLKAIEKEFPTADADRQQKLYQEREELTAELAGAPSRRARTGVHESPHDSGPVFSGFKADRGADEDPCPTCHSHGFGKLSKQDRLTMDIPWSLIEKPRTPFEQEKMYSGPNEGLQPVWNFKISKDPVGYKKTNESTGFNTWYFDINGKLIDIREPGLEAPEWYADPLNFIPVEGIGSLGAAGAKGAAEWGAEMLGRILMRGSEDEGAEVLANPGKGALIDSSKGADPVVADLLGMGPKNAGAAVEIPGGKALAGISDKAIDANADALLKNLGLPQSAVTVLPNGQGAFIYEARTGVLRVLGHGVIPKNGAVRHAGYSALEIAKMIKAFPEAVKAVELQGCNLGATDFPEMVFHEIGVPIKSYTPVVANVPGQMNLAGGVYQRNAGNGSAWTQWLADPAGSRWTN
ncbi:MAG TPA: DUF4157 domain-containing protein [Bryobacteraceae bacterium]